MRKTFVLWRALLILCGTVLCLGTILLAWSYVAPLTELYCRDGQNGDWEKVILFKGRLCLVRATVRSDLSPIQSEIVRESKDFRGLTSGLEGDSGILGFYAHEGHVVRSRDLNDLRPWKTRQRLDIPLWFPIVLSISICPSLLREWRRKRAQLRGWCLSCSYDLRGNVSGRCPECGTEVV